MARGDSNYFNTLGLRRKVMELGQCRFMSAQEFSHECEALKDIPIVILGCGAQGLNQGLNLRDSGLDVSYALREEAIKQKRKSWQDATEHGFQTGTFEELIPRAGLVINLTPDKQHASVIAQAMPLMKQGACLSYSHGFNIVEEGQQIRPDITVIMVAPKGPGTEVREEYLRGFGVPTLIAVHGENDPSGDGLSLAKAYAAGLGSHRAGVLESSFVAEVKSDLMGEQTILCGLLYTYTVLCYEHLIGQGHEPPYATRLLQTGWETIAEALKLGGITHMMNRLSNPAKIRAFELAIDLRQRFRPLFAKRLDDILSGEFSATMMTDWDDNDAYMEAGRSQTDKLAMENTEAFPPFPEQQHFDHGIFMVAVVKAGVETAFELMSEAGILDESAYYESLHEVPLITNLIARNKLGEMCRVISDTAEYGTYLFSEDGITTLRAGLAQLKNSDLGPEGESLKDGVVDNMTLIKVNAAISDHPVERIGATLRGHMKDMKQLAKSQN